MKIFKKSLLEKSAAALSAVALVALIGGCSTDSPTAPQQGGQNPGSGQGAAGQWIITVTASPSTIELASDTPTSTIGVEIVQSGTGAAPPEGTLFQLSVTNGTVGGASTINGQLSRGRFATLFEASTPGTAVITAQLEQSIGQKLIQVLHPDDTAFAVTQVEPNVGKPSGGEIIAIIGTGFRAPANVRIGGADGEVVGVQSNRIRVRTPPSATPVPVGQTRTVAIDVTIGVGTQFEASKSLSGIFTYAHGGSGDFPQIHSLSPDAGPVAGGNTVLARGSDFGTNLRMMIQGRGATPIVDMPIISSSSSAINFVIPAASLLAPPSNWDGFADVWVQDLDTGLESNKVLYHYGATIFVSSIVPSSGTAAGGDTVTIVGSGFEAPLQVFIGDVEQTVLTVTPTAITVLTAPADFGACDTQAFDVVVKSVTTGVESDGDVKFTYLSGQPIVASVSPGSRPHSGGGSATITGSNFGIGGGGAQVSFGSAAASNINVVSESTITVTVPASGVAPVACDDNGDGVSGTQFPTTTVPVTVVNLPQGCTGSLAGAFLYPGTACDEPPPVTECSNGIDDDGDTFIDFPADPQCSSAADDDESS